MERYTELSNWERRKRKRLGLANFLYVRYADDWGALGDGSREHAEALREELYRFLKEELKLELSMDKTRVTHVSDGFVFLGYLIDRQLGGSGKWVPQVRIPARAMEKVRGKIRAATQPGSYKDSVRIKIIGLNRIIRGWCQYYQYTSSPSIYFGKLGHELFWDMAHWLGRKYDMNMPAVMQKFHKGKTFGTDRITLVMPTDFKAKPHRAKKILNPYAMSQPKIEREALDDLGGLWVGTEARRGQEDSKAVVYQRDQGLCGICGNFVPWEEAHLDHLIPRERFDPPESGDGLGNLWILHRNPCHLMKTKRERQGGRRVR